MPVTVLSTIASRRFGIEAVADLGELHARDAGAGAAERNRQQRGKGENGQVLHFSRLNC